MRAHPVKCRRDDHHVVHTDPDEDEGQDLLQLRELPAEARTEAVAADHRKHNKPQTTVGQEEPRLETLAAARPPEHNAAERAHDIHRQREQHDVPGDSTQQLVIQRSESLEVHHPGAFRRLDRAVP